MFINEQVEDDVQRRMLAGQFLHATRRRMNAHQQLVERQHVAFRHDELAVENRPRRFERKQRLDDLRKIAIERLSRLRAKLDARAIPERQAAEAIPFGLVLPLRAFGKARDELRFHCGVIGRKRKDHCDLNDAYDLGRA